MFKLFSKKKQYYYIDTEVHKIENGNEAGGPLMVKTINNLPVVFSFVSKELGEKFIKRFKLEKTKVKDIRNFSTKNLDKLETMYLVIPDEKTLNTYLENREEFKVENYLSKYEELY